MQYCMSRLERQLGFLIGGDMVGASIGGGDLSTTYTSNMTAR